MKTHNYIRISLIIHLLFLGSISHAQNIKEDIQKINENYVIEGSFQQEIRFQLFASYETKEALQSYTALIQKEGKSSYMKRGKVESLSNENFSLLVDHESKAIILQGAVQKDMSSISDVKLDSMLSLCSKTEFESKKGNLGIHHFYFKDYRYDKVSFEFSRSSYLIKKMTLYSRADESPMRVEISFFNVRKQPNFPKNTFSANRYLDQKAGVYSPNANYSDYQLLNYLSKQ